MIYVRSGMCQTNICCTLNKDHVLSNKHHTRNVRLEYHHPFVRWMLLSAYSVVDGEFGADAVAHVDECASALYDGVDVSEHVDGNVRDCNDAYGVVPVDTSVLQ